MLTYFIFLFLFPSQNKKIVRILSGEYFFQPSHQQLPSQQQQYYYDTPDSFNNNNNNDVGWVSSSSGATIDYEQALVRAAETIILTGDIMVQQSKHGTSWKE